MVAYFKWQNNLFMVGGFLAGALISLLCWNTVLAGETNPFTQVSFVLLLCLLGIVLGRLASAKWCNSRLTAISNKLYRDCDPEGFLKDFAPLAARVPRDNVVHADAQVKISFAHEAMGEFQKGLDDLEEVRAEELKLHSLQAKAITENQRMRLYLLLEDLPMAGLQLEELEELEQYAGQNAKMLGEQLHACNVLSRNWYHFLTGDDVDLAYLREEADLAKNDIYRAEMELLVGRVLLQQGNRGEAETALRKAAETGKTLYPGREARRLLETL